MLNKTKVLIVIILSAMISTAAILHAQDGKGKGKDGKKKEIAYHYGEVAIGKTRTANFKIRNVGKDVLKVMKIESSQESFIIGDLVSNEIQPGGMVKFQIEFAPKKEGWRKSMIIIYSNDPDNGEFEFTISGVGGDGKVKNANANAGKKKKKGKPQIKVFVDIEKDKSKKTAKGKGKGKS